MQTRYKEIRLKPGVITMLEQNKKKNTELTKNDFVEGSFIVGETYVVLEDFLTRVNPSNIANWGEQEEDFFEGIYIDQSDDDNVIVLGKGNIEVRFNIKDFVNVGVSQVKIQKRIWHKECPQSGCIMFGGHRNIKSKRGNKRNKHTKRTKRNKHTRRNKPTNPHNKPTHSYK
jgi:hypothetical protein